MTKLAVRKIQKMAGISPEPETKEKRRSRKAAQKEQRKAYTQPSDEPLIPKEYAEDVDFVEIKSYSEKIEISQDSDEIQYKEERQVSDAEYTIIKESKRG